MRGLFFNSRSFSWRWALSNCCDIKVYLQLNRARFGRSDLIGRTLSRYKIIRTIGSGGVARFFPPHQSRPRRRAQTSAA
jgi:hypothetical protein